MKTRRTKQGITVNAISGTHVIFLGFDATEEARTDLLGFAIRRSDLTEHERYWLRGYKTFEDVVPHQIPGLTYPTFEHPIQSFQWADYTAKPDHDYTFDIVPLYGEPKFLEEGPRVSVSISTESEISGTHSIYFNRGVAASQAYANRFQNRKPDDVPHREAYKWLSRGLEEAILKYISKAKDDRFALRAAVYEFNYHPVLEKFKEASENGADVQIVYDARKKNPREATEKAINEVGIQHLVTPRTATKSYISHNKFIVLLKDNEPVSVWTGSTNFTKGGIFGQSNVGHIVRDKAVAQRYLDYWLQLKANKTASEVRLWTEENPKDPVGPPSPNSIMTLFSPRKTLSVLEWYADQLNNAKQTVALTAAFGVNPVLAEVLGQDKEYLRYLLLETEGDNRQIFGADRDVQIAVGSMLSGDALYSWTRETLSGFNQWVKYIHTKYMLIDPLSNNPITITGSANFSEASTKKNDENMLVISSDKRVAHIYFGEFMRLFSHYYFRALIQKQKGEEVEAPAKLFLNPKPSWTNPYYREGNLRFKRRKLFSGNE